MHARSLINFPRAFAFAVDDVGWVDGRNQVPNGPFRAGVKRIFDLQDYIHLVTVGKNVGARIQCLFILSEMDRENILAKYPTTTHLREKWINRWATADQLSEIMEYVKNHAAHLEFGLHGTGHEYWSADGKQYRAEWYNLIDRKPWPEQTLREHLQAFQQVMNQYGLTTNNGHSFPESFAPCAYSYYWNPTGTYSLGKLLAEVGVKYANTDFGQIPELLPPQDSNGGDFDHGVHVINRHNYGNHWYELASLPKVPLSLQYTDIIESHWPNWLAQDDSLQETVTQNWIGYYQDVQKSPGRYIAKNTEQLHSQWLYKKFTKVTTHTDGSIEIDNTGMPSSAYDRGHLGNLVLKIKLNPKQHVSFALLGQELIPAYFEAHGFGFLYLPTLARKKYTLLLILGSRILNPSVWNDCTCNIYHLISKESYLEIKIRAYGFHILKVRAKVPIKTVSLNPKIKILSSDFNSHEDWLEIKIDSSDFQGTTGEIRLIY